MVDRDLRLGFRALSEGIIRPDQLREALGECLRAGDRTLSEVLEARGFASAGQLADLELRPDRPSDGDRTSRATPRGGEDGTADFALVDANGSTASVGDGEPTTRPWAGPDDHARSAGDRPTGSGRYQRARLLGIGGLGRVWLARDVHLGREVALKELRDDRSVDPGLVHRFVEEARITSHLEHPGIVPVYDMVEEDGARGLPFYTMRFLAGRTLAGAVQGYHERRASGTEVPLEFRGLLDAFTAVCQAVAFAHSRGVLHRDLKGSNVLLGDFGEVFVIDWGLAKSAKSGRDPAASSRVGPEDAGRDETEPGSILGTPGYIAPELVEGARADFRSDVYSLGSILYLILTGRPAYVGTAREVLRALAESEPRPPRSLVQDAPAALEAACLKAMSRDPSGRYGSATELAEEVRRWLADEPVKAYREPLSKRLGRRARKHRAAVLALSVALVSALIVQSVAFVRLWEEQRRTAEQKAQALRQATRAESGLMVTRQLTGRLLSIADNQLIAIPGTEPARAKIFEAARKAFRWFLEESPQDSFPRLWTAHVDRFSANLHRAAHRNGAAGPLYQESISLLEGLAKEFPRDSSTGSNLSLALSDHASWLGSLGRLREAAAQSGRAVRVAESTIAAFPGRIEATQVLAKALVDRAMIEGQMGDQAEAARLARRAVEVYEGLPGRADWRDQLIERLMLGWSWLALAEASRELGRPSDARAAADRGLEGARALLDEHPEFGDTRDLVARLLLERAASGEAGGDLDEALALEARTVKESPETPRYREAEAAARRAWGAWRSVPGSPAQDLERAAEELDASRRALESLAGRFDDVPGYRASLALTLVEEGRLAARRGHQTQAIGRLERAVHLLEGVLARSPEAGRDRKALDEARQDLDRARALEAGAARPAP